MYKDLEKLIKTEKLEKGSRQRRMRFNPETDVSNDERETVQTWTHFPGLKNKFTGENAREKIGRVTQKQPMNPNAKSRAMDKYSKVAEMKVNPETGKRQFLMHRSMSPKEYDKLSSSDFNKNYTSSWTPDYKVANGNFGGRGHIVSAWIDEDDIAYIPSAIGSNISKEDYDKDGNYDENGKKIQSSEFRDEYEAIVHPHKLNTVKYDPNQNKDKVGDYRRLKIKDKSRKQRERNELKRVQEDTINQTIQQLTSSEKYESDLEKMFSTEEAFKMGTDMLLKKCMKNADNMDVEELRKNWRKGVANLIGFLGLAHAAHYMGQPGVEQLSERQKSPIYQRVQQKMDAKAANRNPSNNLSVQDQVKQARKQGRAEGDAIIDKNYENSRDQIIDDYLYSVSGAESSFGKNTKHKKMTSGIHNNTSAFGSYGLMPNTVVEMANRMDRNNPLKAYNKMSPTEIHQSLKENPDHEYKIAKFMANHLYDKHNGDLAKMAYVRTMGHNLAPEELEEGGSHANWKNHSYPQKVMKFYNKLQDSKKKKKPQDLNNTSNNPM